MKTFAVQTGAATFILAHHVVKVSYDTTRGMIVLTDTTGKEHLLNGNAEQVGDLTGKLIHGLNHGAVTSAPVQQPSDNLCASCGMVPPEVDGLCQPCCDRITANDQSFNGPVE
jgi:hypothetical protein